MLQHNLCTSGTALESMIQPNGLFCCRDGMAYRIFVNEAVEATPRHVFRRQSYPVPSHHDLTIQVIFQLQRPNINTGRQNLDD